MSDLVARLHSGASEYEPHRVEADLFREAAERIEALESELAQTKRNMTHVEDCWGNIQSALGETEAELAKAKVNIAVTDEDAIRILRGYWRDVAASFYVTEIQNMVELLEAFVARKLKAETP